MDESSTFMPDVPGQPSTVLISVDEAALLFAGASIPRNSRTIRRYCVRGDLECNKTENALHQPQYFISKASVETYIEQQRTLLASRPGQTGQVQTAPGESGEFIGDERRHGLDGPGAATSGHDRADPDKSTPIRPSAGAVVVEQLEARIKDKDAEIAFLRGELLHRRTTDTALHDVIAAFRANAEAQRLAAGQAANDIPGQSRYAQQPAYPHDPVTNSSPVRNAGDGELRDIAA